MFLPTRISGRCHSPHSNSCGKLGGSHLAPNNVIQTIYIFLALKRNAGKSFERMPKFGNDFGPIGHKFTNQ